MKPREVRAVLFDFDGTLTLPGAIDFEAMRSAVGCPPGRSILGYLESIADPVRRNEAEEAVDAIELEAADRAREQPGAAALLAHLRRTGFKTGILTRNSRASIERSMSRMTGVSAGDFDLIITRDDDPAVKPSPEGVLAACGRFGLAPAQVMVVGDYVYDVEAGRAAGAVTVFFDSAPEREFARPAADYRIESLLELIDLVDRLRPLPTGKLPNYLMSELLRRARDRSGGDPSLLLPPGVGVDVAVVDAGGLVAVKSDPITFAVDHPADSLLVVNANDIAAAGGIPRWLLVMALLPPGTTRGEVEELFDELISACTRWGIALVGGHTELTPAVGRPILAGTLVGTVEREMVDRRKRVRTGDVVLMTKWAGVEGSAIIAARLSERLAASGLAGEEIAACRNLSSSLSVVDEARIAAASPEVRLMHDITEGGVAVALRELSTACGHRLRVDLDAIPILPQTSRLCAALGLDPLGLIGSGSLLVCCSAEGCAPLTEKLAQEGIPASPVGELGLPGEGIDAHRSGRPAELPPGEVEELTRLADLDRAR